MSGMWHPPSVHNPYPPSDSCPCQFLSILSNGSTLSTVNLQCQTTAGHMIGHVIKIGLTPSGWFGDALQIC